MDKFLVRKRNEDEKINENDESVVSDQLKCLLSSLNEQKQTFKEIYQENFGLHLSYISQFLTKSLASNLLKYCENTIKYYDGDLAKIRVFGKWHQIPRKQIAFGDEGLIYKFSGNSLPAQNWTEVLERLKNCVNRVAECEFNFVLVNRYANGDDYIGEHRDAEQDLDPASPIASLSLGQSREFVLRHEDRRKGVLKSPDNVKMTLEHGTLLLMRPPTNHHWYHSVPKRKRIPGVRINFTFRKILIKK